MKKYLLIALLLSACASGHVEKPRATQVQVDADVNACKFEMAKASGSASMDNPFISGSLAADVFNTCMAAKGYVHVR